MKRELSQEELVERWTLAPNELLLLMNKSGPGRLGFAALLKFFQAEGRFPAGKGDVPDEAIRYLVQQTKTVPSMWADYDRQGRTIKYHRAEIRSLYDFRGKRVIFLSITHIFFPKSRQSQGLKNVTINLSAGLMNSLYGTSGRGDWELAGT